MHGISYIGQFKLPVVVLCVAFVTSSLFASPAFANMGFIAEWGQSKVNLARPSSTVTDSKGDIYVSDKDNNRILKFDGASWQELDKPGAGLGDLNHPEGLAVDNQDNLYIADTDNNRILKFDGKEWVKFAGSGSGLGNFFHPEGIAADSQSNIYIADTGNNRVQIHKNNGWTVLGGKGSGPGQFEGPKSVTLDVNGNLYVADTGNNRVEEFGGNLSGPSCTGSSISARVNQRVDIKLSCSDADGDALSYSKVSDPSHGTVTINQDGTASYIPNADFTGTDSFEFKANDGTVDSNIAAETITISSSTGGGGDGSIPLPSPTDTRAKPHTNILSRSAKVSRNWYVTIKVNCESGPCNDKLTLLIRKTVRQRHRTHKVTKILVVRHIGLLAGQTAAIRIKLPQFAIRLFKARKRLHIVGKITNGSSRNILLHRRIVTSP